MTDSSSSVGGAAGEDIPAGDISTGASTSQEATQDAAVTTPTAGSKRSRSAKAKKPASLWRELPVLVVVAIVLAFVFKTFFIAVFFIPSASMQNTLIGADNGANTGDRVVTNKLIYDFRDPHRGEIVVFNGKTTNFNDEGDGTPTNANGVSRDIRKGLSIIGLGSDPNEKDFIKRVIAVGGDTVGCPAIAGDANTCAHVVVNGHPVDESSYLFEDMSYQLPNQASFATCTVPKGDLFVMGDHRDDSSDSRPNGSIPVKAVIGRAFAKVYPFSRIGGLGVPKVWQANFTPTANAPKNAPLCMPLPPGQTAATVTP